MYFLNFYLFEVFLESTEKVHHNGASSSRQNTFQDPQWTPETADSTKPYIYYFIPTNKIPMIDLFINRVHEEINNNNKIGQL